MSNNNVLNEKKKALLAYKEKILDDIKYAERSIEEFRSELKNKKRFYDDNAESSDSEDDLPSAIDQGPSITELKIQQAMKKTCLHATQELIGLVVLQSEVDVLVEEPKFEGECPVTEAGTWREVTAECRIDLVPFTMSFFMHTPHRKFGPPSYRGLRVAPVKSSHELELSNSVLHTLKNPSDAVEVIRSYAAGYRSRRSTLLKLANKYNNSLFMEPHAEGGFVLKCADLLEVSWKLENKWSPVAPFYHKMEFDLEFMEESFIKIITQAHKELLDPAIQTDERTLLLAKIITTCLEAKGPIDPESDLESKTTERENDIDRRESESEKRDSEVMAPPKSLPKKGKQKKSSSLPNTAEKRKIDDENGDSGAKKMRNDASVAKRNTLDNNNPRKSKISDVTNEGAKKRKISEVNKIASAKNVKETGNIEDGNSKVKETHLEDKTNNTKAKNVRESGKIPKPKNLKENEDNNANTNSKPKNTKESISNEDKNTKNKVSKEGGDTKEINPKTKVLKEPAKADNSKPKTKIVKETIQNQENDDNNKLKDKNTVQNKETGTKKAMKEPSNTEKVLNNVIKTKKASTKDAGDDQEKIQDQNINKTKKKAKDVVNTKSKENVDINSDAGHPKNKINTNIDKNINKVDNKTKNTDATKVKKVANTKNNEQATKKAAEKNSNVASSKNDDKVTKKTAEKNSNVDNTKNNDLTTKNVAEKNNIANNKIDDNTTKKAPVKVSNVANTKNDEQATKKAPVTKVSNVANTKNIESTTKKAHVKVSNVANTKNDEQTSKKASVKVSNFANTKNDEQTSKKASVKVSNFANSNSNDQGKKVVNKNDKNKEKLPEIANKGSQKNVNEKTVQNKAKNDAQTVKKVTEKNATNLRIKDKISQISTKVSEKIVKDKPAPIKVLPEKVLNSNLNTKTKNIIKKPFTKIASHRSSLKPLNPPKVLKPGNTNANTGNTEKENGGKGSKIPQKTMSTISEGSSKKNMLRMSPRQIPSKFKTQPQETLKQKIMKYTNIPRLLKKPSPKMT